MNQNPQRKSSGTLPGLAFVSMAFLMGSLLGGLLMLVLSALPVEPSAKPSAKPSGSIALFEGASSAGPEDRISGEAVVDWRSSGTGVSGYRSVGIGEASTASAQPGAGSFAADQRLLAPLQKRLNVGILLVLGVCLVGATMIVALLRRADARLDHRMRRFELLVSRKRPDWLTNLDADLEGQWEEERPR